MPNSFPHLFLKNPQGTVNFFDLTRGRETEEEQTETATPPQNYARQKSRLGTSLSALNTSRTQRIQNRTLDIPEHIDYVKIYFLVLFNDQDPYRSITRYRSRFGLAPVYFEDFNKTVTFAIVDEELFRNFTTLLSSFINSPNNTPPSNAHKLLTIIHDFEFITTSTIVKSINENAVLFELYTSSEIFSQSVRIKTSLGDHLRLLQNQHPELTFTYQAEDTFLEIRNIDQRLVRQLTDNFDVFHRVQSLKAPRVRPSEFGLEVRDYGFETEQTEDAPLVGVLDTGVRRISPLENIIENIGYDITSDAPNPTIDISGHGTAVAGLVALGLDFYKTQSTTYRSAARIVPIKVLRDSEGVISVNGIVEVIRKANQEHGIRLFNLSINDSFSKFYNTSVSEYAYALDKLAYELDILIFISTGNLGADDIDNLKANDSIPFHQYPNHFYNPFECSDHHVCEQTNLCSPAESYNNITVGAIADNLRDATTDMTLDSRLPAFYTRKFHYDYSKKINGSLLKQNQYNFKVFKPDIVLPGGDVTSEDANMQVLGFGNASRTHYKFGSGTSYATPLATNIAAKILQKYPMLKMQSVKALIINSAGLDYDSGFLTDSINTIREQGAQEMFEKPLSELSTKERKKLDLLIDDRKLLKHLCGHGRPQEEKCISSTASSATIILEDRIQSNSHKVINISFPEYLNSLGNEKSSLLAVKATLCYKFNPVLDNHLAYCPIHISFNFLRCLERDANTNVEIIANRAHPYFERFYTPEMTPTEKAKARERELAVKANMTSWSDDFFPLNSKPFSNVQQNEILLRPMDLNKINNTLSVVVRAVNKTNLDPETVRQLSNALLDFSLVITVEERSGFEENRIYQELIAVNNLEQITVIDNLDAEDLDIQI